MASRSLQHQSVLLPETLQFLNVKFGETVLDGTLGLGGHAEAILPLLGPDGHYYAFDLDQENLSHAQERLAPFSSQISFFHDNFAHCYSRLQQVGVSHVDAILLDLGLSSPHVDDAPRGFSFQSEGPLDMRFDRSQGVTAADVLAEYAEEDLKHIFYAYGEEPYAPKLARMVVERRKTQPLVTTTDLMTLIGEIMRFPKDQRKVATRIFQALRIAVNDEMEVLKSTIPQLLALLAPGGRVVILSYHSLEDRIVKQAFRESTRECVCPREVLRCACAGNASFKLLTKKPIVPSDQEISENPRSRSAKLRALQKL